MNKYYNTIKGEKKSKQEILAITNLITFLTIILAGIQEAVKECNNPEKYPRCPLLSEQILSEQIGGNTAQPTIAEPIIPTAQPVPIAQPIAGNIVDIPNTDTNKKIMRNNFKRNRDSFKRNPYANVVAPGMGPATSASFNNQIKNATDSTINFLGVLMYRLFDTTNDTIVEFISTDDPPSPENAKELFLNSINNQLQIINTILEDKEAMEAFRQLVTAYSILGIQAAALGRDAIDEMADEIEEAIVRVFGGAASTFVKVLVQSLVDAVSSIPGYGIPFIWFFAWLEGTTEFSQGVIAPPIKGIAAIYQKLKKLKGDFDRLKNQKDEAVNAWENFVEYFTDPNKILDPNETLNLYSSPSRRLPRGRTQGRRGPRARTRKRRLQPRRPAIRPPRRPQRRPPREPPTGSVGNPRSPPLSRRIEDEQARNPSPAATRLPLSYS